MIWALVENRKIEAKPKLEGICPLCGKKVISKCGEIYVWHWAHVKDENCDTWSEPESAWHKHWKATFGKENSEVLISKESKTHFADILTKSQVVIELQNSPISKSTIREREEFYGERMIWLLNGEEFRRNLTVKDEWEDQDSLELKSLPRKPIRWKRSAPEVEKGINGEFFKWKSPRRSWEDVQRPLFIDFGEDSLFMVEEGMGTTQIRGVYIKKEKFIKKYGGDFSFYIQIQNQDQPL